MNSTSDEQVGSGVCSQGLKYQEVPSDLTLSLKHAWIEPMLCRCMAPASTPLSCIPIIMLSERPGQPSRSKPTHAVNA